MKPNTSVYALRYHLIEMQEAVEEFKKHILDCIEEMEKAGEGTQRYQDKQMELQLFVKSHQEIHDWIWTHPVLKKMMADCIAWRRSDQKI